MVNRLHLYSLSITVTVPLRTLYQSLILPLGALRVQCLAQGHFSKGTVGAEILTSNLLNMSLQPAGRTVP